MSNTPLPARRERIAWWLLAGALAFLLVYVTHSLVGTVALGVFFYYGIRPFQHRIERFISHGTAGALTLLLTVLPFLLVVTYFAIMGIRELAPHLDEYTAILRPYVDLSEIRRRPLDSLIWYVQHPRQATPGEALATVQKYLGIGVQALTSLFVSILLTFYLLRDDRHIAGWFQDLVGRESATYAYVTAVDQDLETIYFSNVLLVLLVAGLAELVYHGYNFIAPHAIGIPVPTLMAAATGLASLVPLIVGKVVYVPLVGYLSYNAFQLPGQQWIYPAALLVVAFLLLDLVPMTFLLPQIAARDTHIALTMFGYVIGTIVFGWYGLFLGPFLVVLIVQVVRIGLHELVQGDELTPHVRAAESLGSDPPVDVTGEGDTEHSEAE